VDGANLYEYVMSSPVDMLDRMGLASYSTSQASNPPYRSLSECVSRLYQHATRGRTQPTGCAGPLIADLADCCRDYLYGSQSASKFTDCYGDAKSKYDTCSKPLPPPSPLPPPATTPAKPKPGLKPPDCYTNTCKSKKGFLECIQCCTDLCPSDDKMDCTSFCNDRPRILKPPGGPKPKITRPTISTL